MSIIKMQRVAVIGLDTEIEKLMNQLMDFGAVDLIHSLNEKLNKLNQDAASLNPWVNYDPPLEITGTGTTALFTGVLPAGADTEGLSAHLEEEIGTVLFKVVGSDKDMFYTAVLTPEERQDDVLAELKQSGFSQVTFKAMTGTVSENLKRIEVEKDVLEKEI